MDASGDLEQRARFDPKARSTWVEELKRCANSIEAELNAYVDATEHEARDRAAEILANAERAAEEIHAYSRAAVRDARAQVRELRQERVATRDGDGAPALADPAPDGIREVTDEDIAPGGGVAAAALVSRLRFEETAAVRVEVGPLNNLEAVRAVERALTGLHATGEVYLKTYRGKTAVIEATGLNEHTLLTSMRASFPIPFILRGTRPGRLSIQVNELALPR